MDLICLAYDFNAWEAFVKLELDQPFSFPKTNKQFAAAILFHPGEGKVAGIAGWDTVASLPNVVDSHLSIKLCDNIPKRDGVSNVVGRIIITANTLSDLKQSISYIKNTFKIMLS